MARYHRVGAEEAAEAFAIWRKLEKEGRFYNKRRDLDKMLGEEFLAKHRQPEADSEPEPKPQQSTMKENWDGNELFRQDPDGPLPF